MRYFKYSGALPDLQNLQLQSKNLTLKEQKAHRRGCDLLLKQQNQILFGELFVRVYISNCSLAGTACKTTIEMMEDGHVI